MSPTPSMLLDSFDRKILEIVQRSNRTTSDQIAEQVGLSPAAVQRRLKKMREHKVIQADIAVVDPRCAGRPMTFVVQVTLERERADLMDAFKKEMKLIRRYSNATTSPAAPISSSSSPARIWKITIASPVRPFSTTPISAASRPMW